MSIRPRVVLSLAALLPSLAGCLLMPTRDSVAPMVEKLPELSQGQPKPLWQTNLVAQETDFIRFLAPDRVLVGTVEAAHLGWGLEPRQLLLLNAATGEILWTASRDSLGTPQLLLATDPVILLGGSKKFAAFNPRNGSTVWEQSLDHGSALPLPDGEHVVLYSRTKNSVSLTAVALKDGAQIWSARIDNYPEAKDRVLEAKAAGRIVLLVGPELVAVSAGSGEIFWRKPFSQAANVAVALGNDLYLIDGSSVTRSDPATGNGLWRRDLPADSAPRLMASEQSVFVLAARAKGEASPDAIHALDRRSGRALWKTDLPDHAQSSMTIENGRIYLTTASSVLALDASQGSIVFNVPIPTGLQARRQLPDIVRITDERIVVAREAGVMAVRKQDGRLLYATSVPDGSAYTNDYATHRLSRALESATPFKAREALHAPASSFSYADTMYRTAVAHQEFVYHSTAETLSSGTSGTPLERQAALTQRMHAAEATGIATQAQWNDQRMQAGVQFGQSLMGLAGATASGIDAAVRDSRWSIMNAQARQAFETHALSLQDGFYIRPRYELDRGWSLTVVSLGTGKLADILLTAPNYALTTYGANLPAFAVDPSGSRILSKGLGLDRTKFQTYEKVGYRDQWIVPYPSVLAFDLASLNYEHSTKIRPPALKSIRPEKRRLNDQLINAAFQGDLETVSKSLDAGADVNAVDEYGQTALMLAAESLGVYRKKDMIALLLERGADVSIKDPVGWTALEHFRIVSGLLSDSRVNAGFSLLEKAQEKTNQARSRN